MEATSPTPKPRLLHHFVGRGQPSDTARLDLLVQVVNEGWLVTSSQLNREASKGKHNCLRMEGGGGVLVSTDKALASNERYLSDMVCFCDIAEGDLQVHTNKYHRFGLSLDRSLLISKGARPVWYIPRQAVTRSGKKWKLLLSDFERMAFESEARSDEFMMRQHADFEATKDLPEGQIPQELIDKLMGGDPRSHLEKAMNELGSMITMDNQVLGFMKFFDSDLPDSHLDSYYMEREWRVQGNVRFELDDVACLWAPSEYASDLASRLPALKSKIRIAP